MINKHPTLGNKIAEYGCSNAPVARPETTVVAVGASAGGLEAFTSFLQSFPAHSGMALIFVQHLDPTHESMIPRLLTAHTKMPVLQATNQQRIEPDHVYVIAPGTYVAVHNDMLAISEPKKHHGVRMPFDFLLATLSESHCERGIGVVLTGNGTDGTIGLQLLKDRGGLVIAQKPSDAAYPAMPQSAIDSSAVDLILSIDKMPTSIMGYVEQLRRADANEQSSESTDPAPELAQIINLLFARTEQDFSAYKPGTLLRRIARRMAARALDNLPSYLSLLMQDASEVEQLAKDLLIHVTSFFRDNEVFSYLSKHVIPAIVEQAQANQTLRIWVPSCSSGEEVYSLAILFLEEIDSAKKSLKLQMFGSDINEAAVAAARTGVYPATIKGQISPQRLERYFIEAADGYRIAPVLRESAIFTVQDLLSDPPFAKLDFVSCRNLLIYLLPDAQHRVLSILHFALRHGGVLLLGIAENLGLMREEFESVSDSLRIFRRTGSGRKTRSQLSFSSQPRAFWPRPSNPKTPHTLNPKEMSHQALLDSYAPPSVLIDHTDECVFYFGATDRYLQIAPGDATHSIFGVARQGLRARLRTAIHRVRKEHVPVSAVNGTVLRDDKYVPVRIDVRHLYEEDKEYVLVSFVDEALKNVDPKRAIDAPQNSAKTEDLEKSLEVLQQELREMSLELENSSADQEAINEEAQSLNEEYQSTNEELETSKEELQSLNEELTALNAQLTATVNQQRNTANDLDNILRSSELSVIFLDLDLHMKFFSPAAKSLLGAIDSDLGRPIGDLASQFDDRDQGLIIDIKTVLKTLTPSAHELRSHAGDWYTRRILPYRTLAGAPQGVIITFSNISAMKAAERRIEAARAYANNVLDTVRQPQVVIDESLTIVSSNNSFRTAFGLREEVLLGQHLLSIGGGRFNTAAITSFLTRASTETAPIEDYELDVELPEIGSRTLLLSSRRLLSDNSHRHSLLLAVDDITDRKAIASALELAKSKAEKANLGKSRFLAAASHDLRQPLQTLSLLQGILGRQLTKPSSLALLRKLDETLGAMSGMLDTLLDINQLEAGTVQPEIDSFDVMSVLDKLSSEFAYVTKSKGLSLHVVRSSLRVRSDPLLLSQMIRNLLSNAVKYTKKGRILLGCRRSTDQVRIEVWDTGIGIPSNQLSAIFEEYHQLANPARERGLGLGLGLSIVHRIGELLGHRVNVRSKGGGGSVFSIEVPCGEKAAQNVQGPLAVVSTKPAPHTGTILVVDDDPSVRQALEILFNSEGYHTIAGADGADAFALLKHGSLVPDIIVADYNLPGGRTGLQVVTELRRALKREVPAVILTGDISTNVLRKVVTNDCSYLHKPVNADQLMKRVEDLMGHTTQHKNKAPAGPHIGVGTDAHAPLTVFIVDDDATLLSSMRDMLQQRGYRVVVHRSAASFLAAYRGEERGCLIVDSVMPGMSGLELLKRLEDESRNLPSIVITGYGDIAMAIKAMKAGAIDFIEKPARPEELLASIADALLIAGDKLQRTLAQQAAGTALAKLTAREREVLDRVVLGLPNKQIAYELGISQRTVETHRAAVMRRTSTATLPDLIRLVMRAS